LDLANYDLIVIDELSMVPLMSGICISFSSGSYKSLLPGVVNSYVQGLLFFKLRGGYKSLRPGDYKSLLARVIKGLNPCIA